MVRFVNGSRGIGSERSTARGFVPPYVVETDTAGFRADVIEASRLGLVLVDFWAPWCRPCRTLGPVLDKIALDMAGLLRIAKINVDDNQALAGQLRIQSIPSVFAFQDGQPVDAFTGTLPEGEVRAFIGRLMKADLAGVDSVLARAEGLLEHGGAAEALGLFEEARTSDPESLRALAGILRCRIALGDESAVREIMTNLSSEISSSPELLAVRTILEITADAGSAEHLRHALGRLSLDPEDHGARLDAARALFAKGDVTSATDHLIESLKRDPTWNESMARKQLVKIWDVLGPSHPVTVEGRRRLSTVLFS